MSDEARRVNHDSNEAFGSLKAEIAELRAKLEAAERERDAWKDTAEQHCRNQFFYHDLVVKIGEPFGVAAKTSDDGSIQQDVLALKVLELVDGLRARVAQLEAALDRLVTLYGHYAELLNMHDGGKRIIFRSAQEWLDRLAALAPRPEAEERT